MYGLFTNIYLPHKWPSFVGKIGKSTIHGAYGIMVISIDGNPYILHNDITCFCEVEADFLRNVSNPKKQISWLTDGIRNGKQTTPMTSNDQWFASFFFLL